MQKLNSEQIRSKFIQFFKERDHHIISASSVVPKNDPSLLFINSGMAPLKKYFLGVENPPLPRLANFQPCIRTKDIDDVGDRHHLTFFEMLGSWSIGDYYKQKAVALAYELLVDVLGFDPERLWVTVYKGDPKLGLPADDVSAKAWQSVGMPSSRILALGEDNFWGPAGETGPCGPCTEVFFDTGPEFGPEYQPGQEFDTTKRYIEIWNAGVFMELNKKGPASFEPLPLKSVDTGSGLERMAMVMNGVASVYETDMFLPLVELAKKAIQIDQNDHPKVRMIADHMRAASLIIAQGIVPGNEGANYIPRRLLRKCIAQSMASKQDPLLLIAIAEKSASMLSSHYHELKNPDALLKTIKKEIVEFGPVVENGMNILKTKIKDHKLSGSDAFDAVTTFGLPLEIIDQYCSANGVAVDMQAYQQKIAEHKLISKTGGSGSKGSSRSKSAQAMEQIRKSIEANNTLKNTFVGYKNLSSETKIIALFSESGAELKQTTADQSFWFVTESTPFYGESGGQVGDRGELLVGGNTITKVTETKKINDLHIHLAEKTKSILKVEDLVTLQVEDLKRAQTALNHSATHLLHAALRQVLGDHVSQKGSLVDENRLRFDFQHPKGLTPEELTNVEGLVNKWIQADVPADVNEMNHQEAIKSGAMALFGEKYGDQVRVVAFGGDSIELCGGTHVERTSKIGLFLIQSESSISKGVRRIEGLVGNQAFKVLRQSHQTLNQACKQLNTKPDELLEKLTLLKKNKTAKPATGFKVLEECHFALQDKFNTWVAFAESDPKSIRSTAEKAIKTKKAEIVVLFAINEEKKCNLLFMVSDRAQKKYSAKEMIQPILKKINGRGGGKPNFAQGGGELSVSGGDFLKDLIAHVHHC